MDCVVIIEQPRSRRNSQKDTTHPRTTGLQKNQETDFPNRRADKKLLMNWSPLLRRSLAATKYDNEFITKSLATRLVSHGCVDVAHSRGKTSRMPTITQWITKWWSSQDSTVARFSSPAQRRTPTVLKYENSNKCCSWHVHSVRLYEYHIHHRPRGSVWIASSSLGSQDLAETVDRTPHTLEQRVCK